MPDIQPSKQFGEYLDALASWLDVPDSRYEEAVSRYKSIGAWLGRPESTLLRQKPNVYLQGSFRLGTPIRPLTGDEEYDIDIVCELIASKSSKTQRQLKVDVGIEVKSYAQRQGMNSEPADNRRCWTLNYAEGAQFHVDILPALPDASRMGLLLQQRNLSSAPSVDLAISITDKTHVHYTTLCEDWNVSNPRGYGIWFDGRMQIEFANRRKLLAESLRKRVEEVPEYKIKTPLQRTVQILKRHRDLLFAGKSEDKPISVIITTLAAHAYNNESRLDDAYRNIVQGIRKYVEYRNNEWWIPNPVNPLENFADKWGAEPKKAEAFFFWLGRLEEDYKAFSEAKDLRSLDQKLDEAFGLRLSGDSDREQFSIVKNALLSLRSTVAAILRVPHRQKPAWPMALTKSVGISAEVRQDGFRSFGYQSDGMPINKHASIIFTANTDAEMPYKVFWQVVNTGSEAEAAKALRGVFYDDDMKQSWGHTRKESTLYHGKHWVECFIVKNDRCIARSGEFIVNVK